MKKETLGFQEGDILTNKYEVLQNIGSGWEGEVYLVNEIETDIERAVKFFFPNKNKNNKTLNYYAKKLHKLRNCDILIQYHTQEVLFETDKEISFLVSEFVEGELLSDFIKSQPGKRLHPFQALHLLHSLVKGVEEIHRHKEYHGDIHSENIIIQRYGIGFDLKLIDMFRWNEHSNPENIRDDVYDIIKLFYDSLGGKDWYYKQSDAIKSICCGLKKSLIHKKFKSSNKLREYLENLEWE